MKCRHCKTKLNLPLIDLGSAPPSNAYLTLKTIHEPEKWFPLRVLVCKKCWLVQTEDFAQADDLFNEEYAYFSSFSVSWLKHAENYVKDIINRLNLNENSHVVEVAANDGYLLQYMKANNIPCTGIEPTRTTASAAREKGISIIEEFFGKTLANKLVEKVNQVDLIIANNVLAHVQDINDFVSGFAILLKPNGVATFEFPHLLKLIKENQFDTIYHEHFSYLSLTAVEKVFENNGLRVFDVEEHNTHGGSLRILAKRADTGKFIESCKLKDLRSRETEAGIRTLGFYSGLQEKAYKVKVDFLSFLIKAKQEGKRVAAYGAAAKGNTLLNYAGIKSDLIDYVIDKNPNKQKKYMPGSRVPIKQEKHLKEDQPEYVVILPWNLKKEISAQLEYIRKWDGKFVIVAPKIEIF